MKEKQCGINVDSPKFEKVFSLGRYFGGIYNDYKTVALETVQDARNSPLKTFIYTSSLAAICYFIKTNPSETQFYNQLTDSANDLATLGDLVRNRKSDKHVQYLKYCSNAGLLRRFTFGVCSVMWVDNFDPAVDLYEARCKLLKVGWLNWHERVVDVGVLGRWRLLDKAMTDYDINCDEWTE